MSSPTERPWTNREKNYLLAEVIKSANLPYHVLADVIRAHIKPVPSTLVDVPLPRDRPYGASWMAFDAIMREQSSSVASQTAATTSTSLSQPSHKRPYSEAPTVQPGTRLLAPKPAIQSSSQPTALSNEPPQKRKRGRPPKHEAERKARAEAMASSSPAVAESSSAAAAAAARSRPPPPNLMSGPLSRSYPAPTSSSRTTPSYVEERKPSTISTTRMEISELLTPNAPLPDPQRGDSSGSSSGRRRRVKSSRPDPEPSPTRALSTSARAAAAYEAQYSRPAPPRMSSYDQPRTQPTSPRTRDALSSAISMVTITSAPYDPSVSPGPLPPPRSGPP